MAEDEMVREHHQLNGHELEQTPGDSGGQGSLMCYSPQGCKESDMTQQLNDDKITNYIFVILPRKLKKSYFKTKYIKLISQLDRQES